MGKRRKLVLLFFFGIGLPSLLLIYLAFRGIQNDRALLAQDQLEEHRRASERITLAIDRTITRSEQTVKELCFPVQDTTDPAFVSSLLILKKQQPLIEEVFLFQDRKQILFPDAALLFKANGSLPASDPIIYSSSVKRNILNGQRLEFRDRYFRQALVNYQRAFQNTSSPQGKGSILNAISRAQKKSELFSEAIKTNKTIIKDYSQIYITNGIPLGISARLELGTLHSELDDIPNSLKDYLELYEKLVEAEWILEKAQYEFFLVQIKNSIETLLSQASSSSPFKSAQSTYQELGKTELEKRARTEKLLIFQNEAIPNLRARATRNSSTPDAGNRFVFESGENSYYVSLLDSTDRPALKNWGFLINAEYLNQNLTKKELTSNLSTEGAHWTVKGREGQSILSSQDGVQGDLSVRSNFEGNFPDWTLEIYQEEPRILESFLTSRRGIFFYMFFLIAGILIFGLYLTIRAVTHEIEFAKLRSDFVSTVSHEFKSPLTSIRQIAEMLHSGRVPSEERRQKYYDILLEQSERLSLLTENVLNFAKMEEGKKKFVLEKTDIRQLLTEITHSFQGRIRQNDFDIDLEIEESLPHISVELSALSQAINNLIDNAIKYSGEAKRVKIKAFSTTNDLVISVRDFGLGIRKEEQDRVFDRFYRGGDELTRTVKGSGLGLTLVKQIVEAHSGKVLVESQVGQGSTFSLKFPFSEEGAAENG